MEELWALSHAKFLLQHIRLGHDLLWHDIKKQFCFFLYPELNEGFIFRLWLMPMLIIMYLFKHLYGIMHRCLHSRAAHNPLITWVFRSAYFVPVGVLFPPINSLVIPFPPLSVTGFWQLQSAFPQAEKAEQQPWQWGCPQPCTASSRSEPAGGKSPFHHTAHDSLSSTHRDHCAALLSPSKIPPCFPLPSSLLVGGADLEKTKN